MIPQETKKLHWPDRCLDPCGNCGLLFRGPPAAVVTPSRVPNFVCLSGRYCSWNCAKRRLIGLRNRPWFALLAITALKTGARLPIVASEEGKPPHPKYKEVVRFIPKSVNLLKLDQHFHTPELPTIQEGEEGEEGGESGPVVFESVSMIQSSLSGRAFINGAT